MNASAFLWTADFLVLELSLEFGLELDVAESY